jgi:hypothetical protein
MRIGHPPQTLLQFIAWRRGASWIVRPFSPV